MANDGTPDIFIARIQGFALRWNVPLTLIGAGVILLVLGLMR